MASKLPSYIADNTVYVKGRLQYIKKRKQLRTAKNRDVGLAELVPNTKGCDPHEFVLEKVMREFDENETKFTKLLIVDKRYRSVRDSESKSLLPQDPNDDQLQVVPQRGV